MLNIIEAARNFLGHQDRKPVRHSPSTRGGEILTSVDGLKTFQLGKGGVLVISEYKKAEFAGAVIGGRVLVRSWEEGPGGFRRDIYPPPPVSAKTPEA